MMELSQSLKKIIKACADGLVVTSEKLRDLVEAAGLSQQDLEPFSQLDHPAHLSYGRQALWSSEHWGMYAMSWNPGDFTAIHGHGHTECGLVYFFGEATHRVYQVKGQAITLSEKQTVAPGSILPSCTGDFYHAMGNLGHSPFMTLHIYGALGHQGPSTEDSQIFEIEKDQITTTKGPAFLNLSSEFVKATKKGILTDPYTKADYFSCITPYYQRTGAWT